MKSPQKYAWPIVIVLAIAACNSDSLTGTFVLDDVPAFRENGAVFGQSQIAHPTESTLTARPVLLWSFRLPCYFTGIAVLPIHLINIAIHAAAALLIFGVLNRLGFGLDRIAGSVALIWAVHPLNTESVTYMVQRAESLCGMFYLAAIYCIIRRGWRWQVAAVAASALAMGTKELAVTLPIMALLVDRTFLSGSFWRALNLRRWMWAGFAATWIILVCDDWGLTLDNAVGFHIGVSPLDFGRGQLAIIARYLRLSFWPVGQTIEFQDWPLFSSWAAVPFRGWMVAFLILLTAFSLWRWPRAGFIGAWTFGPLAPSSSLIPIFPEVYAEHRFYLSLIGPIVVVMLILYRLAPSIRWPMIAAITASLATATWFRNRDWHDDISLWSAAARVQPKNQHAQGALGTVYLSHGDIPHALEQYRKAAAIDPNSKDGKLATNLIRFYESRGLK